MFEYLNLNPVGIEENDCVTRAIALCTGKSYFEIRDKLQLTADLLDCDELCVCCYHHLIDDVFKFPRVRTRGLTAGEFAEQHPVGLFLIRMDGHASAIYNGTIMDLFDCSSYEVTDAWYCGDGKGNRYLDN